jgi:hypothetical protein
MKYFILILIVLSSELIYSQNYFIPLNIRNTYEKGTRSMDGTPGPNYWQNSSTYNIKAEVDPVTRKVSGEEDIIYTNNSPDTLNQIVIRLYQNFYKYGAQRNFPISPEAVYEGVQIHKASIGGEDYIEENDYDIQEVQFTSTNIIFRLRQPLFPKSDLKLYFSWNFIIPAAANIRMGTYDSTTFFVAYWFPQVAVYDDIDGWDMFDYNGEQEFYNDFSDFNVEIKVPNNFGVWATGTLQNPESVLPDNIYNRYMEALESDSVVSIITIDDPAAGRFNNQNQFNLWRFRAENSPDFAFSLSDHYLWDAVSMPSEKGRTYIASVYNRNSEDFYHLTSITRNILNYFETELPAVEYPYPSLTIFNGHGGMEFPMIINNASLSTVSAAAGLAAHEAAHMYFPFYMGINERKYAFMDEGWAVMLPREIQNFYGSNPINSHTVIYENLAGTEADVPPMVPSTQVRGTSYRNSAYFRPGLAYHFLRDYMGDSLFIPALHKFMHDWNGKHPTPYDFYFSFNASANEDLEWFWKPWFFDYSYPDLAITSVEINSNEFIATITRKGEVPVPVWLIIEKYDGSVTEIRRNAGIWKNGVREYKIQEEFSGEIVRISLNSEDIPDIDRSDNFFDPDDSSDL